MKDRLVELLARIPGAIAQDVAELLWLAQQGVTLHEAPGAHVRSQPRDRRASQGGEAGQDSAEVGVPRGQGMEEDSVPGLPGARTQARPPRLREREAHRLVDRALHRLGPRASVGAPVVDMSASLKFSARLGGMRFPVFARVRVAVGYLVVLEDRALSMAPFRAQIQELIRAARRGRRFIRVESMGLSLSQPDLVEAPRPWRVCPGGQPMVILLVQDGRAPALRGGGLRRWLDGAPPGSLIAWIHPWDQDAWIRTPVTGLRVGRPPPRGTALPLIPLTGSGLEMLTPWAQRRGPGGLLGVELPRRGRSGALVELSELVAAFQYRAHPLSRAAVGLAAGVPGCVDLDLLRALGTQLTMGRITPTHLAEAMTSGLFRRSGEGESTVIAFVSEQARREGLRWLPRADLPRILNYVIRYVEDGLDTDPWLCLPSLPLLVALHNRQAPPEGVELKVGRIGELRAWVNATGFVVHEKLRTLMDGSAELVRPVTRRNHTAPSIREVVFRERERLREIVEMGLRQLDLSVDQADEPVDITDVVELELSIDHIEVAEHEASALVHLSGKAMLMGSFSRTDYDNAISDSEDGTWHNAETVYETATFKVRWNTGFEVWTDSETVHPLSGIPKIHIDSSHFFHDELDILSSEPSEGYDEDDHEPLEQDDFEPKNSEPEPSEPDGQNLPEVDDFAPEDHEPESPEPVELEFESSETNNQESEPGEFRRHDHESETPKAGDALPESDDPERGDFEDAFPEPDEREPQPSELEELGAQPGLTVLASEEDDRNLFEAWCAGDLRAGNVLAKRHYARLRRFFLSKDEQHYQDLTNRTFLECIKSRHNFRGDITFRGYLFAIAYRVLCRHLQERRRRDFESFDPEVHAVVDTELPEMSSYVLANEQARMLLECLRRLTINAQTVLELRYWSDLTEPEIQEVLKLKSRETVAGRLRVAKAALQREWARVQPGHALADADFDAWMLEIRGHVDAKNPRNV